jgi:hypothetical protein
MKSPIKTLLFVLVPLTLVLAVVAGIATAKENYWATASICGAVALLLATIVLGVIRLAEVKKLQQTSLRLGQILGTIGLLGLVVLAAGGLFFLSCAANFSIGH